MITREPPARLLRRSRHRSVPLVALCVAALALVACDPGAAADDAGEDSAVADAGGGEPILDMADPTPDRRLSLPENADPQDPAFQDAAQQCAQHLDGGGILMGGDGSGGGMVGRAP